MDGTGLLRPLLVGKFAKPRCLTNVYSIKYGKTGSLRKQMRGVKHDDLDNAIYHWFVQVRERKLLVSTHILKERWRNLRLPLA